MSNRAYYSASVKDFLITSPDEIIGIITSHHSQDLVHLQTNAWGKQIEILQASLKALQTGAIKTGEAIYKTADIVDLKIGNKEKEQIGENLNYKKFIHI